MKRQCHFSVIINAIKKQLSTGSWTYFLLYILLNWGCVRTQRTPAPLPTGLRQTDRPRCNAPSVALSCVRACACVWLQWALHLHLLVSVGFILYDTQLIIARRRHGHTDHVLSALFIYLFICKTT